MRGDIDDDRTTERKQALQAVWIFAVCCNITFDVSADDRMT